MRLRKSDELQSLIKGIELIAANETDECYYYEHPLDNLRCRRVIWQVKWPFASALSAPSSCRHWSSGRSSSAEPEGGAEKPADGLQYPYLVCNIGSGVSVIVVRGHNDFKRVTGCSIGGGFFHGESATSERRESGAQAAA